MEDEKNKDTMKSTHLLVSIETSNWSCSISLSTWRRLLFFNVSDPAKGKCHYTSV